MIWEELNEKDWFPILRCHIWPKHGFLGHEKEDELDFHNKKIVVHLSGLEAPGNINAFRKCGNWKQNCIVWSTMYLLKGVLGLGMAFSALPLRRRKSARQWLKPTWSKTNTKHMGASNLASMATERLQPFVPTTCPRWVSISILSNQSFCLNSLYQKAKHIAGFTRAPVKAFDRSRLTIRLGQFALNSQVKLAGPKAAANRFREQQVG